MRFFTTSIRQQIILGFLIVLVLLLLFSWVSYYQINQVQDYAEDINPLSVQIDRSARFARALSRAEAGVEQYLLTSSSLYRDQVQSELDLMRDDLAAVEETELEADDTTLDQLTQDFAALSSDLNTLFDIEFFELPAGEQNTFVVGLLKSFEQVNNTYTQFSAETLSELARTSERQQDILSNLITLFIVLGTTAVVVAIVTAQLVATLVAGPVARTAEAATQMAEGNLAVRVRKTNRRDEIGQLSNAFNEMADQLSELVTSLERRVEARTRDLQIAAQVSEQAALIRNIDVLLPFVVELTKEQFDLYHVHIYLYDDDRQNLVLAAGAGDAGRIMKERGHRIPALARSLVAQSARENRTVIVDDVKADPNFLANPLLPNTRSEAALPLTISEHVIGVIDVQSAEIARFDADLLAVLGSFSSQLAIAVENARLFSEMQQTGRQEHVLGAVSDAIQRATNLDDVLQTVTRELGRALGVAETAIQLRLPAESGAAVDPAPPGDVSTSAVAT